MEKMITSAYASKLLKNLEDAKNYLLTLEENSSSYTVAEGEEPVIPAYNFTEVSMKLAEIDAKIIKVKHALNRHNVNAQIQVRDEVCSVDEILVSMAQMNRRRGILDRMRKELPKTRLNAAALSGRTLVTQYHIINYDLDAVRAEYDLLTEKVMAMQMALDRFNQTETFALEID